MFSLSSASIQQWSNRNAAAKAAATLPRIVFKKTIALTVLLSPYRHYSSGLVENFLAIFRTVLRICTAPWMGNRPVSRNYTGQDRTAEYIKTRIKSMPRVRFEPKILILERFKTVHASNARSLWKRECSLKYDLSLTRRVKGRLVTA
jgi:hypothetical protein